MMDEALLTQRIRELAGGYHVPPIVPSDAMWARIAGDVDRIVTAHAAVPSHPMIVLASPSRRWMPAGIGVAFAAVLCMGIGIGRWTAPHRNTMHGDTTPGGSQVASAAPLAASVRSSTPTSEPEHAPLKHPSMNPLIARHAQVVHEIVKSLRSGPNAVLARGVDGTPATLAAATPVFSAMADAKKDPGSVYDVITDRHLADAEAMLTAFRADAKSGRVDPQLIPWARDLLATTRVLYDAPATKDPDLKALLADLELVFVQIVANQPSRATDLDLARQAVDQRHILPRLREVTSL